VSHKIKKPLSNVTSGLYKLRHGNWLRVRLSHNNFRGLMCKTLPKVQTESVFNFNLCSNCSSFFYCRMVNSVGHGVFVALMMGK